MRFVSARDESDAELALKRLSASFHNAGFEEVVFEYEPVAAAYHYERELDHDELILIAITRNGEIMYDRSNIGIAGIRPTVSSLLQIQERPVVIQADRSVTTDLLVRVMDEAKLAGAGTLSIATIGEP